MSATRILGVKRMPGLHELTNRNHLDTLLLVWALGIGESHSNRYGRQLAIDLLRTGFVTNLFLELPETAQNNIDKILADPEMDRNVAAILIDAWGAPYDRTNPLHLADVVIAAREANVPAWATETHRMTGYTVPFCERHEAIKNCVFAKTQETGLAGSLLLWGADHFTSTAGDDVPLQMWIPMCFVKATAPPLPAR